MKTKEDILFKKWKRSHKLDEGFLDGEEEQPITSDDSAGEENEKKEETNASIE